MQRVAVAEHERLGGAVGRLARERLEGGRRGSVQDGAPVAADHARREDGAQVDHGLDVGPEHVELAGPVGAHDRAHGGESGVVDQDLDAQAEPVDPGRQLAPGRFVGQVRGQDLGPDPRGAGDGGGQLLQAVLAPGHQRHPVAAASELAGHLGPDARRGAGDQAGGGGAGAGSMGPW